MTRMLIVLALAAASLAACGKKGDPIPPEPEREAEQPAE